jgi:hypothetical protein
MQKQEEWQLRVTAKLLKKRKILLEKPQNGSLNIKEYNNFER